MDKFVGSTYNKWNEKRLRAILEHYGVVFFPGKTILTVGCGYGVISYELQKLGAKVIYIDARQEHLDFITKRNLESTVVCMDIDKEWPEGHWDMIIHLGVLYHLEDPIANLRKACVSADHLILETEVVDSNKKKAIKKVREPQLYTQSIGGLGLRPGPVYIERTLSECDMSFERLRDNSCNAGIHKYDWKAKDNDTWKPGQRCFWFAKSISIQKET